MLLRSRLFPAGLLTAGLAALAIAGPPGDIPRTARNDRPRESEIRLPQAIVIDGQLTLLEYAQVCALEAGAIASLEAHEGLTVQAGQELGRLDDARERLRQQQAEQEVKAANKKAANTVDIRFARAARDLAQAELDQAHEANQKVSGAIPQSEVRRRALGLERAKLQVEQAAEEHALAQIAAVAKVAALDLAQAEVDRRRIMAPVSGVVVDINRRVGEWVKPGDPVLRILRIDRLRVEGHLDAREHGPEILGRPVTLTVALPGGRTEHFSGKVVFVSPEVEPVDKRFRIVAEVANRDLLLRPGMDAKVTIQR